VALAAQVGGDAADRPDREVELAGDVTVADARAEHFLDELELGEGDGAHGRGGLKIAKCKLQIAK
jgi:hypothetical protein